MNRIRTAMATSALASVLVSCSTSNADEGAVTYTFSNHCGESISVTAVNGGGSIAVLNDETRTLSTFDQEPNATFVVTNAVGDQSVQIVGGMSTITIEGDDCPNFT